MISLLYRASQAGVKINLCVRGICCLMPGVEGLSENITIKRLVDQYLEHSRLFIFGKDDSAEVIMGSADWMTRNLYHRIEVCVSIKNVSLKKELIDYFEIQWSDNTKSVELTATLEAKPPEQTENAVNAQQSIYAYLKAHQ
jgi:polyphosphate kinase